MTTRALILTSLRAEWPAAIPFAAIMAVLIILTCAGQP